MSMGKRKRDRQPAMWVTTTDLPTAASHPFYRRLNQLLREHGFDDFVEAQCAGFYAATMGRPGLPPGMDFRLLLIGYFEGGHKTLSVYQRYRIVNEDDRREALEQMQASLKSTPAANVTTIQEARDARQ